MTLSIPATASQVEAVGLNKIYKVSVRIYRECRNMKKALLRHIQSALEDKYIDNLIDDDTGLIEKDIPRALEYLFTN